MKSRFAVLAAVLLMAVPQVAIAQYMDINEIISGIGGSKFLRDAERASSAPGLRVERLSTLLGAELNASRLHAAVELKESDVRFLHSNLVLNPLAMWAIRNSGVSLDQIVSVQVFSDGGGVMFADDL